MEQNKDYPNIYLQTLIICWNLQENLDLLQGTNVYRHELKQAAIRLGRELERIINNDMNNITGIEDTVLFKQMDYHRELIKQLVDLKCEDNGVIALIIDKYKNNKSEVLEALNINIVQHEKI